MEYKGHCKGNTKAINGIQRQCKGYIGKMPIQGNTKPMQNNRNKYKETQMHMQRKTKEI